MAWKDSNSRNEFVTKTLKYGTAENRFVAELSDVLERIGLMVITGALPIKPVLAFVGYNIVEDWTFCKQFVQKRCATNALSKPTGPAGPSASSACTQSGLRPLRPSIWQGGGRATQLGVCLALPKARWQQGARSEPFVFGSFA